MSLFPIKMIYGFEKSYFRIRHLDDFDAYSSDLLIYKPHYSLSVLSKPGLTTPFDHLLQGRSAGCTYILTAHAFAGVHSLISKLDHDSLGPLISHDWLVYFCVRILNYTWFHDHLSFILYRQHSSNQYGSGTPVSQFRKPYVFSCPGLLLIITSQSN